MHCCKLLCCLLQLGGSSQNFCDVLKTMRIIERHVVDTGCMLLANWWHTVKGPINSLMVGA